MIQSINNNHGYMGRAFLTSFGIGAAQLLLYRIMPDASGTEIAAYLCGGTLGNVAAQWLRRSDIARIRALPGQ